MSNLFGIGHGSTLKLGDGASPEVFTALATVMSITPPNASKEEVEVTNLQSPTRFREFVSGMKDGGTFSVTVKATSANMLALQTQFNKETDTNVQIITNDELNLTWTFAGRFMEFTPGDLTVDGVMEATASGKVTGASVITETTP